MSFGVGDARGDDACGCAFHPEAYRRHLGDAWGLRAVGGLSVRHSFADARDAQQNPDRSVFVWIQAPPEVVLMSCLRLRGFWII